MKAQLLLAGAGVAALAAGAVVADRLAQRALARFETLDPETGEPPGQRFWVRGVAIHYVEQGAGLSLASSAPPTRFAIPSRRSPSASA
jgi:hypothetical protein